MEQIKNLGDRRQIGHCVYCVDPTETKEDAPSKIFLDHHTLRIYRQSYPNFLIGNGIRFVVSEYLWCEVLWNDDFRTAEANRLSSRLS